MQQQASIQMILGEMNPTALREAAKLRSLVIEHRNTAPYVAALERLEWNDKQRLDLIDILKKNKKKEDGVFRSVQIIKSDDLPTISNKEVMSALNSSPPKKTKDGDLLPGFQDIIEDGDEIKGTFVGAISRIVIIAGDALVERKIIFVAFSIFKSQGHILIKTSRTNDSRVCRESLKEILNLDKLYYASPSGLREEGADSEEYNTKAKKFIDSLDIEEINGVYLRIGGDTKIRSINYRGQGDILEEDKIKDDINNGAFIVGVKGLIREGEPLIDFSINWWWLPLIKVSSEEISPDIADQVILKIAKSYTTNILR